MRRRAGLVVAALSLAASTAQAAPAWPDSPMGRLEVLAVIQQLNGALLASRSATATLEAWCGDHHMATPARVSAELVRGVDRPASAEVRQQLQAGPDEVVKYRRVRLACGGHVLSEADNWYLPGRLTPEMNRLLETTDTPFGRAVQALHPMRQTLAAERLWSPLPPDWDRQGAWTATAVGGTLTIPPDLFRHRALLFDDQRRPFSEVVETYTAEVLDFQR